MFTQTASFPSVHFLLNYSCVDGWAATNGMVLLLVFLVGLSGVKGRRIIADHACRRPSKIVLINIKVSARLRILVCEISTSNLKQWRELQKFQPSNLTNTDNVNCLTPTVCHRTMTEIIPTWHQTIARNWISIVRCRFSKWRRTLTFEWPMGE